MIPADFKAELDRIAALFAQIERELNDLTIKAEFTWNQRKLRVTMEKINGRFRICSGIYGHTRPIGDLPAVDKIEVAEVIYEFKDAYTKYLTELAERAKKAGRRE